MGSPTKGTLVRGKGIYASPIGILAITNVGTIVGCSLIGKGESMTIHRSPSTHVLTQACSNPTYCL